MAVNTDASSQEPVPLLGDLLVKAGLISQAKLDEALAAQASLETYTPLGQILVEKNFLSLKQLNIFLDKHHKRPLLGELLLKLKCITPEKLDIALKYRKTTGVRLGDALIKLDYVSEENLKRALALQTNIPFADLTSITLGMDLDKVITKSYAEKHQVVPLALSKNILTVAIEDPTNYALIQELLIMPKYQVRLVTSTKAMIARVIQRVYDKELTIDEDFQFPTTGKSF